MKRCRICDEMFDDSQSNLHFFHSGEDTCKTCEEVILDTLQDFEDPEEDKEDDPATGD